jgi:[ribosomal protein S18]-alanine N-acetyltransferase
MNDFIIRLATEKDIDFLWDMLYEAIYVPEGQTPPPKDILNEPNIKKILNGWGRKGDQALIALDSSNHPVGAVWIRLYDESQKMYGYVDPHTPILGIAMLPNYRGQGIGTLLLEEVIKMAKTSGIKKISLSVDPNNPALRLYERYGFQKIRIDGTSWDMVVTL